MSKNGVINLHFLTILTQTLEDTINFSKEIGLIPNVVRCPNCKKILQKPYILNRSKGDAQEVRYQCNKKRLLWKREKKQNFLKNRNMVWWIQNNTEKELIFNILFCVSNAI